MNDLENYKRKGKRERMKDGKDRGGLVNRRRKGSLQKY